MGELIKVYFFSLYSYIFFNRPAMIMYGINSIRELVGPRVKMELILDNPVCTIDK